jgi:hypothetical protein
MLIIAIIALFLQFNSLNCQALDANGISLAEKVLAIERLMLTPGTIDFQVAPCDFVLNGPPPGFPDPSGDQVCLILMLNFHLSVAIRSVEAASEADMIPYPCVFAALTLSLYFGMFPISRVLIYWVDCSPMGEDCFPRLHNRKCYRRHWVSNTARCRLVIFTNRASGLDASVGFESGRPENLGTVFPGVNFIDRVIIGVSTF